MSSYSKIKRTRRLSTMNKWFSHLEKLQKTFELSIQNSYKAKHLQPMGIQLSNLDLESENPNSPFYLPLPKSQITQSTCGLPDHISFPTSRDKKSNSAYELGESFARFHLLNHFLMTAIGLKSITTFSEVNKDIYSLAKWSSTSSNIKWKACAAFTVSELKPHVVFTLVSDFKADDKSLLSSEMEALISFMSVGVAVETEKKKLMRKKFRRNTRTHMLCPVLMVSVVNTLQARIIQGHFDGKLRVRYSKLYNFNTTKHKKQMDLFVRWMIPRAHGNTRWVPPLPSLAECSEEEENENTG